MNVETLLECASRKYIKEFFVGACFLFCERIRTRSNITKTVAALARMHSGMEVDCLFADKGQIRRELDCPATTIATEISGSNTILELAKHRCNTLLVTIVGP
jgi:hypothetical protein